MNQPSPESKGYALTCTMKLPAMKTALIAAVSAAALLCFADEYPALRFRGDGRISGGPILGYQIEFQKIPFYQDGEYVFHFRGVPHEELALSCTPRERAATMRQNYASRQSSRR